MNSIQLARYIISFAWLYHGIFPKLLHVAPLEKAMMQQSNFTPETIVLMTRIAGLAEIGFGLIFFIFYKTKFANFLNIFLLSVLLVFAAIQLPLVLVEAFNPVTTNIPLIGLSFVILYELKNSASSAIVSDCSNSK